MSWVRQVSGQGPVLVMLHGWGMESRVFASWRVLLERRFTCITYDLPGHGQTPCRTGELGWKESLQQLTEMLRREEAAPILLGWSLGGLLALGLVLLHPELLKGLVLISSSPAFRQRPDWSAGIPEDTLNDFAQRLRVDPQGTRKRFLALQMLSDPLGRRALGEIADWPSPDPLCLAEGLTLLRDVDLRDSLPNVAVPLQILHGCQDRVVPPAASRYMHEQVPGSRLTLLKQAGHAPFLSQPEACWDALTEVWL
ncbi:MAG: alpha/beta fold hydrolase [Acidithiobacillus sp.]